MGFDAGPLPVALTNTVARVDFNAAMAIIEGSFPLTKENLAGDAVVTIKIKDLNVTTAKIALLAITVGLLGPQAVERAKIKLLAVDTPQLEALAVETSKIDNLAVTAPKIDNDAVETLKIKDRNVTPAKADLGFGRYVARTANAEDFGTADFTKDGAVHVDGLDLSGIVPVGAIAAGISWSFVCSAANKPGEIRRSATATYNRLKQQTQVANVPIYVPGARINIDSNRLLDYNFDATTTAISLVVDGWWI
ncbi:hypothetical protein ES708_16657 [subsurface metagenome]